MGRLFGAHQRSGQKILLYLPVPLVGSVFVFTAGYAVCVRGVTGCFRLCVSASVCCFGVSGVCPASVCVSCCCVGRGVSWLRVVLVSRVCVFARRRLCERVLASARSFLFLLRADPDALSVSPVRAHSL